MIYFSSFSNSIVLPTTLMAKQRSQKEADPRFVLDDLENYRMVLTKTPDIRDAKYNTGTPLPYEATLDGSAWKGLKKWDLEFNVQLIDFTNLSNVDTHGCHGEKCRNRDLHFDINGNIVGHYCHSCNGYLDDVDLEDIFGCLSNWNLDLSYFEEVTGSELVQATQIHDVSADELDARVQKIMDNIDEHNKEITKAQQELVNVKKNMDIIQSIFDKINDSGESTEEQRSYLRSQISIEEEKIRSLESIIELNEGHRDNLWEKYNFNSQEDMGNQLEAFAQTKEQHLESQARSVIENARRLMQQ